MKTSLPRRLIRDYGDSLTLAWGTGVTSILALSFSAYCGHQLGPAQYSVFAAVLSLVTLGTFPSGPINTTLARFAAQLEGEGRRNALRTLFLRMLQGTAGYGLLLLLLLLPALPLFQRLLQLESSTPLWFGYGLIYLTVLLSLPRGVLRGLQRFSAFNTQSIAESGLRLLVGLALVTLWPTVNTALISMAIALLLAMALAVFQLRPIFGGLEPAPADLVAARRFFGPAFVFIALFSGFQNLDILLIKGLFLPHPAGQYGAAATLARSLGILVTPLYILLLPKLVSQRGQGKAATGLLLRVLSAFLLVSALALGTFLLAGEQLIVFLFGADFVAAAPLLAPLALAQILINLAGLLAQPLVAEGRFSFLRLYGPLLLLEALTVYAYHPSLLHVAWVLVAFGAISSMTLLIWLLADPAHRRARALPTPAAAAPGKHPGRAAGAGNGDERVPQKAVFLDRDGVLVHDDHLITAPEQIRLMAGVPAALRRLKDAGWQLIVVTNQTVVARGLIDEAGVEALHEHLQQLLVRQGAPRLDGIYVCPHHPRADVARYRVECSCRKPRPGLLLKAATERAIDLSRSVMVGDRPSDIAAGQRAGCRTILLTTGRHEEPAIESPDPVEPGRPPDAVQPDLAAAAEWILARGKP